MRRTVLLTMCLVALSCGGSKKTSHPPGSDNPKPITSDSSGDDRAMCAFAAECQVQMENEGEATSDQVVAKTDECMEIMAKKSPELHDAIVTCTQACGDCMGYWDCFEMTDPNSSPCSSPEE